MQARTQEVLCFDSGFFWGGGTVACVACGIVCEGKVLACAGELGIFESRPLLSPSEKCNLKHRLSQQKII